jgi:hypothetical protein
MEVVSKAKNIPPKKGLTKVQQSFGSRPSISDNCPCAEICKKIGTFKQGACFLGTSDTHKCLVANNILLAKSVRLQ